MNLTGELQVMELGDLLEWAARRKKTGALHLSARSTHKRLVLRNGQLEATSSNDPRDVIGQFLVRDGLVTEQQLFEALLLQERDRRMLGSILISQGLITPEQLAGALRACAEETVYSVFLWPEGRFDFRSWELGPDHLVPLRLELGLLVEEGRWRQAEWQRMCERLPSPEVTFRVLPGGAPPSDPAARRLIEFARAGHSLARMSLETRHSPFETAAHLLALCDDGVLEVAAGVRDESASDVVAAIAQMLEAAGQRLREGRFDAALDGYEKVLALDPLNQEAKKGLLAVADGRRRDRLGRRVPLDRVPILAIGSVALTQRSFDPQEGFVLSRINGEWNVRSILKLCPLPEEQALEIFARLIDQRVIELV